MARPTKLSPTLRDRIVGYVRAGAYLETAAAAAGVSKVTLHSWLKRGAAGETPYADFSAMVEEAQAMAEMRDLALIGKAAETEWTAAAWRLERKFPDRYGRRTRHEVSGPDGAPMQHEVSARVVVLPPIADAADLEDSVGADGAAGDLSREPG